MFIVDLFADGCSFPELGKEFFGKRRLQIFYAFGFAGPWFHSHSARPSKHDLTPEGKILIMFDQQVLHQEKARIFLGCVNICTIVCTRSSYDDAVNPFLSHSDQNASASVGELNRFVSRVNAKSSDLNVFIIRSSLVPDTNSSSRNCID